MRIALLLVLGLLWQAPAAPRHVRVVPGDVLVAVAHRESAIQNDSTATTTTTITIPASVQTDDVLIVAVGSRDSAGTEPTVADDDTGGNAWAKFGADANNRSTVWWKRATSGTASKTITVGDCVGSCAALVSAFSGADTGATPYEGVSVETNADNAHAQITPTSDGSEVVLVTEATNDTSVTSPATATSPGALQVRAEGKSTGGTDNAIALCSEAQATAAATGAFSWTQNSDRNSIAFAIKPAAGGGATSILRQMLQHGLYAGGLR